MVSMTSSNCGRGLVAETTGRGVPPSARQGCTRCWRRTQCRCPPLGTKKKGGSRARPEERRMLLRNGPELRRTSPDGERDDTNFRRVRLREGDARLVAKVAAGEQKVGREPRRSVSCNQIARRRCCSRQPRRLLVWATYWRVRVSAIHAGHQVRRDPVFDVKRRLVLQRAGRPGVAAHDAVVECVVVVEAEVGIRWLHRKLRGRVEAEERLKAVGTAGSGAVVEVSSGLESTR